LNGSLTHSESFRLSLQAGKFFKVRYFQDAVLADWWALGLFWHSSTTFASSVISTLTGRTLEQPFRAPKLK